VSRPTATPSPRSNTSHPRCAMPSRS